jgi:hypothetical protein
MLTNQFTLTPFHAAIERAEHSILDAAGTEFRNCRLAAGRARTFVQALHEVGAFVLSHSDRLYVIRVGRGHRGTPTELLQTAPNDGRLLAGPHLISGNTRFCRDIDGGPGWI